MAKLLNKDAKSYEYEKGQFVRELQTFHDLRGTPFRCPPSISGKEIDLYLLYWIVTAHGGWEKINNLSGWAELLPCLDIPESTANGAPGIKNIYLRYLEPYEKVHYQAEVEDREDDWYNDDEGNRVRKQRIQKVQATVPSSYNYGQHNVSDEDRVEQGLSTDFYKKSQYDKIVLSLLSPLPNEQDFAINVLLQMGYSDSQRFSIKDCPKLLEVLLSHGGVFDHTNLERYMGEFYKDCRKIDLASFWKDVCQDDTVREILLQPAPHDPMATFFTGTLSTRPVINHLSSKSAQDRLELLKRRARGEVQNRVDDEDEIFASGPMNGKREPCGQRILQVSQVLWGLSRRAENVQLMANNKTCIRFCLLSSLSSWNELCQSGMDILGNLAPEVLLSNFESDTYLLEVMLQTIMSSVGSSDRYKVLSALDILTKLTKREANESFIDNLLVNHGSVLFKVLTFVSAPDLHLLVCALEFVYVLSCQGERACSEIVKIHRSVETLINLVTCEPFDFGPEVQIKMRIIETNPWPPVASFQPRNRLPGYQPCSCGNPKCSQIGPNLPGPRPVQVPHQPAGPFFNGQPRMMPSPQQRYPIQHHRLPIPNNLPRGAHLPGVPLYRQPFPQGSLQNNNNAFSQNTQQVIHPPSDQVQISHAISKQSLSPAQPTESKLQEENGVPHSQVKPVFVMQVNMNGENPLKSKDSRLPSSPSNGTSHPAPTQSPEQSEMAPTACKANEPDSQLKQNVKTRCRLRNWSRGERWFKGNYRSPRIAGSSRKGCVKVYLVTSEDDEERQFCLSWIKTNCRPQPGFTMLKEAFYLDFLEAQHLLGQQFVAESNVFYECLRTVFGKQVGPQKLANLYGKIDEYITNVKIFYNSMPIDTIRQSSTTEISEVAAPSPILTKLLHKDATEDQVELNKVVREDLVPETQTKMKEDAIQNPLKLSEKALVNGNVDDEAPALNHLVNGFCNLKRLVESETDLDEIPLTKKRQIVDCNGGTLTNGVLPLKENQISLVNDLNSSQKLVNNNFSEKSREILIDSSIHQTPGTDVNGKSNGKLGSEEKYEDDKTVTELNLKPDMSSKSPGPPRPVSPDSLLMPPPPAPPPIRKTPTRLNASKKPDKIFVRSGRFDFVLRPLKSDLGARNYDTLSESMGNKKLDPRYRLIFVPSRPFLCEWEDCMKSFKTAKQTLRHAIKVHCPPTLKEGRCRWLLCDDVVRPRLSLLTHIRRHYGVKPLFRMMRRRFEINLFGFSSIKRPNRRKAQTRIFNEPWKIMQREAMEFKYKKHEALMDKPEHPVTKSIRLTASLILKNLVIHSPQARRQLQAFESHLSTVALSESESSRSVSQILFEIAHANDENRVD